MLETGASIMPWAQDFEGAHCNAGRAAGSSGAAENPKKRRIHKASPRPVSQVKSGQGAPAILAVHGTGDNRAYGRKH